MIMFLLFAAILMAMIGNCRIKSCDKKEIKLLNFDAFLKI
jgi:hypothetical protein